MFRFRPQTSSGLSNRAKLIGSAAVAVVAAVFPGAASAQITSDCTPTNGADNCTVSLIENDTLDLMDGDDTIGSAGSGVTLIGDAGSGVLTGGYGDDSITLYNTGTANLPGSTGQVLGDAGNDTISLSQSRVGDQGAATVSAGADNDSIYLAYSTVGLYSGASGIVTGDDGADTISVFGGRIAQNSGSSGQVLGGLDNDSISLNRAQVGFYGDATVSAGDGADTINAFNYTGLGVRAGSTAQVLGDAGNDSITFTGSNYYTSYTTIGGEGAATVSGGDGADTITLSYLSLGEYAGASGRIQGDAGNDSISLFGVHVGERGDGVVSGGDGADSIYGGYGVTLAGRSGSTGQVLGDAGADLISLYGYIGDRGAATVSGGDDDDTITLAGYIGNKVTGTAVVRGDAGNDSISLLGGSLGYNGNATVSGGDGSDTISSSVMLGFYAGASGQLLGDAGDDSISVTGVVGRRGAATVSGGDGADMIVLADATVAAYGTGTGSVLGDAGSDSVTFSNVAIGSAGAAIVDGGADADVIRLTSGSSVGASSSVSGGAGNDTVYIDNSITFAGGATLSGGTDTDTLDWTASAAQTSALAATNFETFVKRGTGNLTLTAASTFSTEARVEAGTLTLSGAGAINSALITVNAGTLVTDGGALSSGAAVVIVSTGNVTVNGNEAVTSVQNAGTLAVSGGNLTGLTSLTSSNSTSIAATRTLQSASASVTAGTLTNAGTLQTTSGATVASGATLASTGAVSGGLSNSGTTTAAGSVLGAVQNAGTFTVSGALTGNGAVTNTGTLNVSGGNFTGLASFANSGALSVSSGRTLSTGGLTMTAGTLNNNGIIIGGFTQTGGVVSGSGTVQGALTVSSGTISPGNSIGTVDVSGNLTLNAGAGLTMEVTDGSADRINVTGAVAINGATLTVKDLVGGPAPMDNTKTYVLIANDGSDAITGSGFASIVDQLAFLTPFISLTGGDGNDVALSFSAPSIDLVAVKANKLQGAVAAAFNPVVNTNAPASLTYFNAFAPLTTAQAAAALQTLAGEAHPAAQYLAGVDALAFAGAAAGVDCGASGDDGWCFSTDYQHPDLRTDADPAGGSRITSNGDGVMFSAGWNGPSDVGLSFSLRYGESDADVGATEKVGMDGWGFAASARARSGPAGFVVTLGRDEKSADVSRAIRVGSLAQTASSSYDVNTNFLLAEASYDLRFAGVGVTPYAAAATARTTRSGFVERGAGAANLGGAENAESTGYADLGVRSDLEVEAGSVGLRPELSIAYRRLLGETTPAQGLSFAGSSTSPFTTFAAAHDRDQLLVGGAVHAAFGKTVDGVLRVDGLRSGSDSGYTVTAGLRVRF